MVGNREKGNGAVVVVDVEFDGGDICSINEEESPGSVDDDSRGTTISGIILN